jgi:hypothetical protein
LKWFLERFLPLTHSTLVVERRKRRKAGNFANPLRAEKPFQTRQRLQDAAKIGTCQALAG